VKPGDLDRNAGTTVGHDPYRVPGSSSSSLWNWNVEKYAVSSVWKSSLTARPVPGNLLFTTGTHHPELGCRIEVRPRDELNEGHRHFGLTLSPYGLVNFHGQVITFEQTLTGEHLCYLVDLTGNRRDFV
jgi:hypothetical protein